jgi:hypothetical protein
VLWVIIGVPAVLIAIPLVIQIAAILITGKPLQSPPASHVTQAVSATAPSQPVLKPKVIRTYLHCQGCNQIVLGKTVHDLAEFVRVSWRGDKVALATLFASGDIFSVIDGQPVSVLQTGPSATEVRVLSGAHANWTGFVNSYLVKRSED